MRQRPASEGWCGTPPCSVSLGAVPAGGEEDEALELAAAVRARFVGGIAGDVWGGKHRIVRFIEDI